MSVRTETLADPAAVAARAAELTIAGAARSAQARGRFVIALSGGSTPVRFHAALAARRAELPLAEMHVMLSDERMVPPDHEHSNMRMARETLLDALGLPAERVHPVPHTLGASAAADAYAATLRELCPDGAVDLAVLGMGADGHTASLFPGDVAEPAGAIIPRTAPEGAVSPQRLSFSSAALCAAHELMVLVTGEAKRARLAEVLGEGRWPLGKVLSGRESSVLLRDRAAAAG